MYNTTENFPEDFDQSSRETSLFSCIDAVIGRLLCFLLVKIQLDAFSRKKIREYMCSHSCEIVKLGEKNRIRTSSKKIQLRLKEISIFILLRIFTWWE